MRIWPLFLVLAACGCGPPAPVTPRDRAPMAAATAADPVAAAATAGCLRPTRLADTRNDWTFSVVLDGTSGRVCDGQGDERGCMDVDRSGQVAAAPEHVTVEAPAWPKAVIAGEQVSYCVAADHCTLLNVDPKGGSVRAAAVEAGAAQVAVFIRASAADGGQVEVWDGAAGKRVSSAAVSGDRLDNDSPWHVDWVAGSVLITSPATSGRDAELWAVSGKHLARVATMEQLMQWGEVAPGKLVTLDASTEIVLWDAATGARLRAEPVQRYLPAQFEAIDPSIVETIALQVFDGGYAVFAAGDALARIAFVDLAGGEPTLVDAPICAE